MAAPDLEPRGGGGGSGFVSLALPTFLPSVIFSCLPKIRGPKPQTPPLDPPQNSNFAVCRGPPLKLEMLVGLFTPGNVHLPIYWLWTSSSRESIGNYVPRRRRKCDEGAGEDIISLRACREHYLQNKWFSAAFMPADVWIPPDITPVLNHKPHF